MNILIQKHLLKKTLRVNKQLNLFFYIKKIDQNDELFNEFFKEDVLIDENIYKKRKRDELNFWNHIFVQKKDDAKRIDNIYKNRPCKKKQ